MKDKYRILVVDDHALLRESLGALLSEDPDLEIVGEAANGRDAIHAIMPLTPHLVLMDLAMPRANGFEAIAEIKRRYPEIKVVVLTMYKCDEYVHESLRVGADGYLLKDASHDDLRLAIRSVLSGKKYLSPDVSSDVLNRYLGRDARSAAASPWDTVTQRERQVLKLIAEGYANDYIAEYLCVSVRTVQKHRSNIMKKLDLHNVSLLTAFAIKKGIVITDPGPAAATRS